MKKNKPINEIEFFPIDIKLPFSNDDGLPEYDPHFFEGIEIYDADVLVLHYILAFFIDYSKTFPEICNVDEVTSKRIIKDYSKAEEILIKLSKIDVPEVYKLLINKDITKIQLTRSILLDNGIKHKSIKDQMKRQAYLLLNTYQHHAKVNFIMRKQVSFQKINFSMKKILMQVIMLQKFIKALLKY